MTPTLTHIADVLVEVGQPIAIGETPQGLRRVVPIAGGTIRGEGSTGRFSLAALTFKSSARTVSPGSRLVMSSSWMMGRWSMWTIAACASALRR